MHLYYAVWVWSNINKVLRRCHSRTPHAQPPPTLHPPPPPKKKKKERKKEGISSSPLGRQCPSGIAQRPQHHAIAVPTVMRNSHKDNVRSSAVEKQLKQKKSSSPSTAQHHLTALDLFSASFFLRVQLTLPPLAPTWTLLKISFFGT